MTRRRQFGTSEAWLYNGGRGLNSAMAAEKAEELNRIEKG